MRTLTLSALLLLFAFASVADAQKKKAKERYPEIWGPGLKEGVKGYWYTSGIEGQYYETKVVKIIDKDTMLMRLGVNYFMTSKHSTDGLADGEVHHLEGEWKVTGTRKYGGRTYRVVEPVEKK